MAGERNRSRSSGASERQSTSLQTQFGEQTTAAIAEAAIHQDLSDDDGLVEVVGDECVNHAVDAPQNSLSMVGKHRRPSYVVSGARPLIGAQPPDRIIPLDQENEAAINEERSLLRDNNLIPPKFPQTRRESRSSASSKSHSRHRKSLFGFFTSRRNNGIRDPGAPYHGDRGLPVEASESSALLGSSAAADAEAPYGGEDDPATIDRKWEDAILAGRIQTSWQRELKTLIKYSLPLVLTFLLQTSLTLTSVFTVGRIGQNELGAVSLGSMTANITGYGVYYGLATSLDTLCAQAYGSGKKSLVGLQLQRMVWFLWACTIPIAILWLSATQILRVIVPDQEIADYAGLYLKILILGAPAFALFESSKRYVQAQGKFEANLYVLLIAAPLNALMHWVFVWKFQLAFIGCPIAVVITENLMPLLLFIYVRFFGGGMECWPGFTRKAFRNWWPMIRLAIPGLVMIMAEMLAFEILVLASARISATHLAAQTVLQSLSILTYQIPFSVSIAASTRVANLIGASLPEAAKTTARVTYVLGTIIGVINVVTLSSLRHHIPKLFSSDAEVVALAAQTLPVNAAFQLFDALAAQGNGVLRGLGKQAIGGIVSLLAYYAVGIPVSFGTAFGLHWDLYGLWAGPAVALLIVCAATGTYILRTSWQKASEDAARRNAAD